jgi:acetyl-CoA acetyltransferase
VAHGLTDKAAIVGIGQTEFSKGSERTEARLAAEAIKAALADAGLSPKDVDGVVKFTMDTTPETELVSMLGTPNLRYFGEVGYGGSAHGAVIGHAAMAVALGISEVVVCYRALNERSGRRYGQAKTELRAGRTQAATGPSMLEQFTDPFGMLTPAQRFGMFVRRHMIECGSTSEQFGHVAVAQRANAQRNPNAIMYGKPLTLEEHQASRFIADPLRLYDCCLESDGAVAVVVTSAERAGDLRQRPVYIMGFGQGTGPDPHGVVFRPDLSHTEAEYTARDAYAMAGLGPDAVDVAGFYDHFSPFVVMALEAYGFCKRGEGGPFVESGGIAWPGGRLPVNTHGGHLSEAYTHGMGHVTEAVRQLRGTSTAQVEGAEVALVGSAVAQLSSAVILRR